MAEGRFNVAQSDCYMGKIEISPLRDGGLGSTSKVYSVKGNTGLHNDMKLGIPH